MKTPSTLRFTNFKRLVAGVGLALALPFAAHAQSMGGAGAPGMDGGPRAERGLAGKDGMGNPGMHHRGMRGHHRGHRGMMGLMRGVNLTDAQRDKIFAMRHAAEPQIYEKMKIIRKSHEDLRAASSPAGYDEAKAKAAIEAGARAKADLQLMRVRARHDVYAMLTPEQKAQVEQNRQNFMRARMSMQNRGGRGEGGMQPK